MTRQELQNQTIEQFKNNKAIALQWATSLGKSKAAIDMVNSYHIDSSNLTTVLLLVAEIAHKDNWKKEFDKWGLEFGIDITIECYASLKNYTNTNFDIIIMDECHHVGSELRLDLFKTIKANKYILLSATLDLTLINNIEQIIGKIKSSKVSLQKAIENNWLPEPKIFLIPLTLDDTTSDQEIIEEWGKKERRVIIKCNYKDRWNYLREKKTKYPNTTLIISCTQQQKYNYISEKIEFYKQKFFLTRNIVFKNMWLQYGSQRKRFLGESKTNKIPLLTNTFGQKRYICFCSSIEQANYLGEDNAIHSEIPNRLEILSRFNNKKINSLYAVGMLVEGVNLSNIEIGIITQLDGQERAFIQKFGRSLRAKDPIQYIFYYKNTRDEEYLSKVLENLNKEYIKEIQL